MVTMCRQFLLWSFFSLTNISTINNKMVIGEKEKRLLLQNQQTASHVTVEQVQLLSSEVYSLRNSLHVYKTQIHDLRLKQNATDAELKQLKAEKDIMRVRQNESEKTIEDLKSKLQKSLVNADGSTYVRWGRTTCPGNGTETVYSGYVGGSFYDHPGAAAEYMCLPKDPQWGQFDLSTESYGKMYGGEYEFAYASRLTKYFGQNLHDHNVPCAVCSSTRSQTLMIPARTSCYGGWTLEYKGYLTSGYVGHKAATQYVCLDGVPELLPSGQNDENGKLFFLVEGVCGSLECPPYVNGKELTCVVCTK